MNYVGASGELDFDVYGDVNGTMEIWRIKDGMVGSANIFAHAGEAINPNIDDERISKRCFSSGFDKLRSIDRVQSAVNCGFSPDHIQAQ